MLSVVFAVVLLSLAVLGAAAGKYYSDRRRYLKQAERFARSNGLAIEDICVAGRDVALSGSLGGRSIRTSIVRMHVDEDTTGGVGPDVIGYYFETYHIEVDTDADQQWLVVMDFRYQGGERLKSPRMPRYSRRFKTASEEFDRRYCLFAESMPAHHLFGDPLLLGELMDRRIRAAHAARGALHVYFKRPMLWKYSSFQRVEELIRLATRIASSYGNC